MNEPSALDDDGAGSTADQAAADLARRRELEDLRWLMGHAQGRRIVWRLLALTGVYRTTFHPNGSTFAYQEGRRSVGCWMVEEITTASPDAYPKMLMERK